MFERLLNFLQPPETKASRTAQLVQFESGGRARWTPRDYAALAREGYILKQGDVDSLESRTEDFARHANVAAIFLNDGKPFKVGERLVQKDLANTLELIADKGIDAFYKGPIAEAVVKASDANGGILSMRDFAGYTAQW